MVKLKQIKQKKKKSQAKSAPRRAATPRSVQRRGLGGYGHGSMAVHNICSVSDPFCAGARGAKWPDANRTRTLAWSVPGFVLALGSDAAGRVSSLFLPNATATQASTSALTATDATYTDALNFPVSAPTLARWRITSWGLRITSPLSRMTATGTCHIRLFSPDSFSSLGVVPFATTMCDNMLDIPLQRLIDQDEYIIPMPLGTDARLFRDTSEMPSLLSTGKNCGWQVVNVAVTGAPVSTPGVINVYLYYNIEYTAPDGDTAYAFSTPPPPSSPLVQQGTSSVLDRVGNFISGAASKVEALFQNKAAQYVASGVAGYLTAGPVGAGGSMLMLANSPANRRGIEVD